ncbi:PAS domain-containing protein [Stutzerimonas xanthomarina]|uniref:PAS domain-containing protein n=1 Tax=Stutzerimonas xanthomarina TaxID=271420 RepID=UPI0029B91E37|nr:PAS domain-containing protein [Stutzerimonas xanthomarina]MDX2353427.1 PAS domain-containing protein [Stutzerimonas xanthomarina]
MPLHSLDDQGRLESVSDAWLILMGYRREDVIGRPLINFMTERSARQMLDQDWPVLLGTGECLNATAWSQGAVSSSMYWLPLAWRRPSKAHSSLVGW